ncbi:MAG: ABC transporter substrate-binding protein [Tenericutes bacterium]|nr:ABC transporter substrate-binding protein [Mycoplasmatota bacterium]
MKKIVYSIICVLILLLIGLMFLLDLNKGDNKKDLEKIRVAEVAHTVFYAPQYAAISQGFFEEEGLDVELILTPGADKVTAAVLSGDVEIGFSGSEACIYVYNAGEKDYLKTFAQLTQKDGSFLVSRQKIDNFTLDDLKGKSVIGGRQGGMPEMTFEWALRQNGIDPTKDLDIDTSVAFAAMGGAFIGGQGDFVTLFEPNALQIEKQGFGYVVASIGELGGVVPYTSYSARNSYLEKNPEIIEKFTRAIQKGLDFVHNHSDEEVAKAILDFFPDTSLTDLTGVMERYRSIDAWPTTTTFSSESFYHLQDIMMAANELDSTVKYEDLIYTRD